MRTGLFSSSPTKRDAVPIQFAATPTFAATSAAAGASPLPPTPHFSRPPLAPPPPTFSGISLALAAAVTPLLLRWPLPKSTPPAPSINDADRWAALGRFASDPSAPSLPAVDTSIPSCSKFGRKGVALQALQRWMRLRPHARPPACCSTVRSTSPRSIM